MEFLLFIGSCILMTVIVDLTLRAGERQVRRRKVK